MNETYSLISSTPRVGVGVGVEIRVGVGVRVRGDDEEHRDRCLFEQAS